MGAGGFEMTPYADATITADGGIFGAIVEFGASLSEKALGVINAIGEFALNIGTGVQANLSGFKADLGANINVTGNLNITASGVIAAGGGNSPVARGGFAPLSLNSTPSYDTSGGWIQGAGQFEAYTFTVEATANLSPGDDGVGTMTIRGDSLLHVGHLDLQEGSNLHITLTMGESGAQSSLLQVIEMGVDGSVNFSGNLLVSLHDEVELTIDSADRFKFFSSEIEITGTIANLDEDGRVTTYDGLGTFRVEYLAEGDGYTIYLTDFQAIPEPSTGGLIALAAFVGSRIIKRRDRQRLPRD